MKHLLGMRESEVVVIFGYVISILGLVYYVEEFAGTYFFIYVFVLSQSIVATPNVISRLLKRSACQEADVDLTEGEDLIKVSDDLYRVKVVSSDGVERWQEIDRENLIKSAQVCG